MRACSAHSIILETVRVCNRNEVLMEYYVKSVVPILEMNYKKFTTVEKN